MRAMREFLTSVFEQRQSLMGSFAVFILYLVVTLFIAEFLGGILLLFFH